MTSYDVFRKFFESENIPLHGLGVDSTPEEFYSRAEGWRIARLSAAEQKYRALSDLGEVLKKLKSAAHTLKRYA